MNQQKTTHSHPHYAEMVRQTSSRLSLALFLTLAFVFIEAAAGIFANSLALLTDAAHDLTDVIALGLSWYAIRLTSQPANAHKTYGYHRAGILVALVNSTTLVLISLGIFYEAYRRFISPPDVQSSVLIGVGLIAVVINLVTALLVHRGSQNDLNLRSAFIHLIGDVLSTVGAVIAGVIIYFTNANWLDPFVSVLIGFLILYNAWSILRDFWTFCSNLPTRCEYQNNGEGHSPGRRCTRCSRSACLESTQNLRTMSAHILTDDLPISAGVNIQHQINEIVFHRYNIAHATLQLECIYCLPNSLYCDLNGHYLLDMTLASPSENSTDLLNKVVRSKLFLLS